MTTGAHVRPEPQEALPRVHGPRLRREDQIEEAAISRAFDAFWDAGFAVPHQLVARVVRAYVADVRAHGGRL